MVAGLVAIAQPRMNQGSAGRSRRGDLFAARGPVAAAHGGDSAGPLTDTELRIRRQHEVGMDQNVALVLKLVVGVAEKLHVPARSGVLEWRAASVSSIRAGARTTMGD